MQRTINRRRALRLGVAGLGGALLAPRLLASEPQPGAAPGEARAGALADGLADGLAEGLAQSDLVYLTPLYPDGRESTCHAEVWFVADGGHAYVVTASDAWRARAVRQGLQRARVWVGDVGVWSRSDGAYRRLPSRDVQAALISDAGEHQRLLERFGDKYRLEWLVWGRRFRNGLADGSRVMLRYGPLTG